MRIITKLQKVVNRSQKPWGELFLTLAAVVLVGAVASRIAIGIALKSDLIPALRSE